MYSAFFEYPGQPAQLAPFQKQNRSRMAATGLIPTVSPQNASDASPASLLGRCRVQLLDPSLFGQIGNAKRTICCGRPSTTWIFAPPQGASGWRRQAV